MNISMFYHSIISDWNHGNAHFLRGVVSELISRGHQVKVYEPEDAWSVQNLVNEHGRQQLKEYQKVYPQLSSIRYQYKELDLGKELADQDLVIVHEWNEPDLVKAIGRHHSHNQQYKLLFHDTHHRSISDSSLAKYELSNYDGVLAFGSVIRDIYLSKGWAGKAWTWHEAADTNVFKPVESAASAGDIVWIGNWGDEERTREIGTFLIEPVKKLQLNAAVYGVRYPDDAGKNLKAAGIAYKGWLPNYKVPGVFGQYKTTVHIPRRPYVEALPGIPTIRVFEALACGIPLVSAPWDDIEGLFQPGKDFLIAENGKQMSKQLKILLNEPDTARALSEHGLKTILSRHTCAHRVDELMNICSSLEVKELCPKV